jgi:outer membrane protein assembly factor BamB
MRSERIAATAAAAVVLVVGLGCMAVPSGFHRDEMSVEYIKLTPENAAVELKWAHKCDFPEGLSKLLFTTVKLEERLVPAEFTDACQFPGCTPDGHAVILLDKCVQLLDSATGKAKWSYEVPHSAVAVLPYEDIVAVYDSGNGTGNLVGLDPRSGREAYKMEVPGDGAMRAADGRIYLVTDKQIWAIDSLNGQVLWKRDLAGGWPVGARITAFDAGNYLVLAETVDKRKSLEPQVLALDFFDGGTQWVHLGMLKGIRGNHAVLWMPRRDGLYCYDGASGKYEAIYPLDRFDERFLATLPESVVFSSTQRYFDEPRVPESGAPGAKARARLRQEIIATKPETGAVKWFVDYGGPDEECAAAVSDQLLLVGRNIIEVGFRDGSFKSVNAFSLADGKLLFTVEVPKGCIHAAACGDMLYVRSRDGWLYALQWTRR